MKNEIKKLIKYSSVGNLLFSLFAISRSYLKHNGWLLSVKKGQPVDSEGKELPWFTYSSIRFIEERLNNKLDLFEYGSGNSTLWFSKRVNKVISIEHDFDWYSNFKVKTATETNINYFFKKLESLEYQQEILNYKDKFDIIVIDGRERIQCTFNSMNALKSDGVIIFDNSDRAIYEEAYSILASNKFKRMDFWGLGPINSYSWCTSIFYRDNNCFNI